MLNKTLFIKDLKDNQSVDSVFLLLAKSMPSGKTGKPYLNLKLSDKSGEIEAKLWDQAPLYNDQCHVGDFVRAVGKTQVYQDKLQLSLFSLESLDANQINPSQFLPTSRFDPEVMYQEMLTLIKTHVAHPDVKRLLLALFEDPLIAQKYKKAPAAKSMHHVFLGGLLEHSLGLARLALDVCKHYPYVDLSYVLAGCLLHDIGKIDELSVERGFEYTDAGKLVGHLVMGIELVGITASKLKDFPKKCELLIKHLIASHHGQLEFGSPKLPHTQEALMLHSLDEMDSKLQAMQSFIEKEWDTPSKYTTYHRLFDRFMYKGTVWEETQASKKIKK